LIITEGTIGQLNWKMETEGCWVVVALLDVGDCGPR